MIVGLFVIMVGLIPIVLAISSRKILKGSELSTSFLLYMLCISVWQADIGVLYFGEVLEESTILVLFKLMRSGTVFAIPVFFYIAYVSVQNSPWLNEETSPFAKYLLRIFSRKSFYFILIWSVLVFLLLWTPMAIEGITSRKIETLGIHFYFPVYGSYHWIYAIHMCNYLVLIFLIFMISKKIPNPYIKEFLGKFSIFSLFLFISGALNFYPKTGALVSSLGVIFFSISIIIAFIRMNMQMMMRYNLLVERQKKLDYVGNLAGSLIHEVLNTAQVIKGFNSVLSSSPSLTEEDKEKTAIIRKATDQIEELSHNYRDYIQFSKIDFKIEDLNEIIQESIDFKQEFLRENDVKVIFEKRYSSVKAFVNKTYLRQVFINLIKNSSQAIPRHTSKRSIKIDVEIKNEGIQIDVIDTGIGIPKLEWESVFDPFTSNKEGGMGMGLPFVKKIIFEHRGDVTIMDSSCQGTHFRIHFPQYEFGALQEE
ncbi:sensor histidine kinase [Peribacillus acanthi]|uniref:sensor histidine kinase n=1 Tax=Peribacillus acanthi TaxID=2171554 RepID=UPI000D3E21A0|nr:sensor histidine kinase [Peribacillus acanthi]